MKKKKNKKEKPASLLAAIGGGIAGAVAVTLVHETVRRINPDAPRMDILGMRAISKGLKFVDQEPLANNKLHTMALAGDLVFNSLYYSFTGSGKNAWLKGSILGLAAGVGGVTLPGPMGLGSAPSNRTTQTQALTVGYYFLGGLVAAAVSKALTRK